jgi:hypothetical protein
MEVVMQIDSALSRTLTSGDSATTNTASAANDDAAVQPAASASTSTLSQDDAVHISPEGAAAAAATQDAAASLDGTGSDSTGDSTTGSDPSAVKSFAYGTLGLERPDQPEQDTNTSYTAGRWLAAGITIGGLISLLL